MPGSGESAYIWLGLGCAYLVRVRVGARALPVEAGLRGRAESWLESWSGAGGGGILAAWRGQSYLERRGLERRASERDGAVAHEARRLRGGGCGARILFFAILLNLGLGIESRITPVVAMPSSLTLVTV